MGYLCWKQQKGHQTEAEETITSSRTLGISPCLHRSDAGRYPSDTIAEVDARDDVHSRANAVANKDLRESDQPNVAFQKQSPHRTPRCASKSLLDRTSQRMLMHHTSNAVSLLDNIAPGFQACAERTKPMIDRPFAPEACLSLKRMRIILVRWAGGAEVCEQEERQIKVSCGCSTPSVIPTFSSNPIKTL